MKSNAGKLLAAAVIGSAICAGGALSPMDAHAVVCARTITADVVALDQPLVFNRMGAQNVNGMIFALRRDVINVVSGLPLTQGGAATPGFVALRNDKRPRPLVLRAASGDCLQVTLTNLLTPTANPIEAAVPALQIDDQPADRYVGFHPQGLQLVGSIDSDSSMVGRNPGASGSLVPPGGSMSYTFFAEHEGARLVSSYGATFGSEGTQGQTASGLFAVVNVEPSSKTAGRFTRFYRSQVTEEELRLATVGTTADGHPILDYEAVYPNTAPWIAEGKAGLPVLNLLTSGNEIVHSDLNAVIVGPNADGSFDANTYPLESVGKRNPTVPNRLEPFREYTTAFHDEVVTAQAFPGFFENDPVFRHTLHGVRDGFMINYGSGGIGSEIIANRLGVGPMHDCLSCAYEEFFLTAHAVGDPAMLVDVPANVGLETLLPGATPPAGATGPKATKAFYPDDPSNVHHSYTNDFVKFRNTHAGKEHHIFHLHNHQWLFNPNDDDANYLDAQAIGPGSGYTYEINFGGSGNRNKTAGDAIFHCHFYPHFAQGMWELWRNHDVFEPGTQLQVSGGAAGFHATPFALMDGTPAANARALPDGEIVAGTPIPALVPLPGKPMAPMPGRVTVVANPITTMASAFHPLNPAGTVPVGSLARVDRTDTDAALVDNKATASGAPVNPTGLKNPGFPFWIGSIEYSMGERPVNPPLDMFAPAGGWDGGLPRHALAGIAASGGPGAFTSTENRLDFSKEMHVARPLYLPEDGTDVEKAAMAYHADIKYHPSYLPDGTLAAGTDSVPGIKGFRTNGSGVPGQPGAPYHEPCVDDTGTRLNAGVTGHFFDGNGGMSILGSSPFNAQSPRIYKGAAIQIDAVFNKAGWHYPQERITALWEDVMPTINKQKPPEPFLIRNNTFDCTMYEHTNLVPNNFELDDYQVRTPTDIIGQHIHLPKWDLTTTDGSGNGWNYEDGTISPATVRERIAAINAYNGTPGNTPVTTDVLGGPVRNSAGTTIGASLTALPHPFFGQFAGRPDWLGARTTLQRWFFDPVVNVAGTHRGLGIIFTHDHFGPSTHQQVGLYSTVLVEPAGSTWVHNETGVPMYTRADGGPTSWQAAILTNDLDGDGKVDSFREFYLEFSDFQHAYLAGVYVGAGPDGRPNGVSPTANSFRSSINPSVKQEVGPAVFPDLVAFSPTCPGGQPRPCPEAISADDPGMLVVNYRNEPVGLRVYDPAKTGPDGKPGMQADGLAGDLAFALQTRTDRKIAAFNTVRGNTPYPEGLTKFDVRPGDPFTPMIRAYYGDRIRVKIQAGGDEETHNATIHGVKWLQGGSGFGFSPNSGWRNAQQAGISEQFTFAAPVVPLLGGAASADHAYSVDASQDGWWSGMWGLMRTYGQARKDLFMLPNVTVPIKVGNPNAFNGVCPVTTNGRPTPQRNYDVTAVLANDVLANALGVAIVPPDASATQHVGGPLKPAGGTLVYNPRDTAIPQIVKALDGGGTVVIGGHAGPLHDPTAMMYVMTADLEAKNPSDPGCFKNGIFDPKLSTCPVRLKAGQPVEPIVLRAAAGECINVTLRNRLPATAPDLAGYNALQPIVIRDANGVDGVTTFNNNLIRPSSYAGLHPALVTYDVTKGDGVVVGTNPAGPAAAAPGGTEKYQWYAGDIRLDLGTNNLVATPVEYGGANLGPADKVKQGQKGLVGALVIEPQGATWNSETALDLAMDHQIDDPGATRRTRASATVNGTIRDFAAVFQKGLNHRYADGMAVENIEAEGAIAEDSEDAGQMAINYGSEPMWFRFGLPPNAAFGNTAGGFGAVPNAHEAFSNNLASAGGDPATPVFTATAGREARLHVLQPTGTGRSSVFNLHGHEWQRDPYICPGSAQYGLTGKCKPSGTYNVPSGFEVGSRAIGTNPQGMYFGGQESVLPAGHFEVRLPKAGGANAVTGDYLFRDQAGFGNTGGLWGILRVQ